MLDLKRQAGETLRTLTGGETTPSFPRPPAKQSISPLADLGLPLLLPREPPQGIKRKGEGLVEGVPLLPNPTSPHMDT